MFSKQTYLPNAYCVQDGGQVLKSEYLSSDWLLSYADPSVDWLNSDDTLCTAHLQIQTLMVTRDAGDCTYGS